MTAIQPSPRFYDHERMVRIDDCGKAKVDYVASKEQNQAAVGDDFGVAGSVADAITRDSTLGGTALRSAMIDCAARSNAAYDNGRTFAALGWFAAAAGAGVAYFARALILVVAAVIPTLAVGLVYSAPAAIKDEIDAGIDKLKS